MAYRICGSILELQAALGERPEPFSDQGQLAEVEANAEIDSREELGFRAGVGTPAQREERVFESDVDAGEPGRHGPRECP